MRATKVTHKDDDYLATGTHSGASGGLILRNKGADFKSCGVTVGIAIYNDTDGSNGLTTAVTEDEVTCTLSGGSNNTWTNGDTYEIYKTATKDSTISHIYTDRSAGRKVVKGDILTRAGYFPDEADLDEADDHIFGPDQPYYNHD